MAQPLNLWTWMTPEHTRHVGVSRGPEGMEVLDLTQMDPALDSIQRVWERASTPELAAMKLYEWLDKDERRLGLPLPSLQVPVPLSECWAAGVTYEISRDARAEETHDAEMFYRRVYDAERPELFFKGPGSRVVGMYADVGLRRDSDWQVPEPELTIILDPKGQVFGYTIGNDMSSRDIEGANPLYLPQAKIFHHSAAIGPGIALAGTLDPRALEIVMVIRRQGAVVFEGRVGTSKMQRGLEDLVRYLRREWPIVGWTALMTGTAVVPPASFTLMEDDEIAINITGIGTLINTARRISPEWADVPPATAR